MSDKMKWDKIRQDWNYYNFNWKIKHHEFVNCHIHSNALIQKQTKTLKQQNVIKIVHKAV